MFRSRSSSLVLSRAAVGRRSFRRDDGAGSSARPPLRPPPWNEIVLRGTAQRTFGDVGEGRRWGTGERPRVGRDRAVSTAVARDRRPPARCWSSSAADASPDASVAANPAVSNDPSSSSSSSRRADLRKQQRRRKTVVQAVLPLLLKAPYFYFDTLEALDLVTNASRRNDETSNRGSLTGKNKLRTRKQRRIRRKQQKYYSDDWKERLENEDGNNNSNNNNKKKKKNNNNSEEDDYVMMLQQKNSGRGLNSHYRQLYSDSLKSFAKTLTKQETDPTSLDETDSVLNELVEAGFADTMFAKRFRKMKENEISLANLKRKVEWQKDDLRRKRQRLSHSTEKLKRFEEDVARAKSKDAEPSEENEEGILAKMIGAVSDRLFPRRDDDDGDRASKRTRLRRRGLRSRCDDDDDDDARRRATRRAERSRLKRLRNEVLNDRRVVNFSRSVLDNLETDCSLQTLDRPLSKDAYRDADAALKGVWSARLRPALVEHVSRSHADKIRIYRALNDMTDLTKPHQWYPRTREMGPRRIIFHGGSTNSGKTYEALRRLKEVERGLYLGPLRLLAGEVHERLTADNVPCHLFTGQEYVEVPGADHASSTVELAPTSTDHGTFDVVVLDEIQMLADPDRGFAWTRALQGVPCPEIHLCGGMEALDLVTKMVNDCGDELIVKDEYQRFEELTVEDSSLSEYSSVDGVSTNFAYDMVEPGDCVVVFSRNDIFAIKREIERVTDHKCCVVYGSLPPETRVQQADLFNDQESGYDVLVATDAIGMGLNLNIKRIIFNSMFKSNGENIVKLPHSSVKQIAGRAGRRNSPFPDGTITCRDPGDMEYLRYCMSTPVSKIDAAGLVPTASQIEEFHASMSANNLVASNTEDEDEDEDEDANPSVNLYDVLLKFDEMATLQGDYFLCKQTQFLRIAKHIMEVPLSLTEKFLFCMAPVNSEDRRAMRSLKHYAETFSRGETTGLILPPEPLRLPESFEELTELCTLHNEVELFMWLHRRFPENFTFEQSSLMLQENIVSYINHGLANSDDLRMSHCYLQRDRRLRNNFLRMEEETNVGTDDVNHDAELKNIHYRKNLQSFVN